MKSIKSKVSKLITLDFIKFIPGYTKNIKQSSMMIKFKINKQEKKLSKLLAYYDNSMKAIVKSYLYTKDEVNQLDIINRVLYIQSYVLQLAKIPIYDTPQVNSLKDDSYMLYIPIFGSEYLVQKNLFITLVNIINGDLLKDIQTNIDTIFNDLKLYAPTGENQPRFIQLARSSNMLVNHIHGNTYRYGYGKNQRLLDSTMTDETPAIAIRLLRDKLTTKKILKSVGVPVTDSYMLSSLDQAKDISKKLSYPVVVKPIDKDSGNGVTAFIQDEESLSYAYSNALKYSSIASSNDSFFTIAVPVARPMTRNIVSNKSPVVLSANSLGSGTVSFAKLNNVNILLYQSL